MIASVVPALEAPLAAMGERYFGVQTLFITSDTDTGLKVRYDDPSRLGADRLVNGATAFRRYGGPALIIDVGTAINLDRFRGRRVSWRHHLSRNRDVPSVLVREDGTASKRGVLQACEFDWYKYRALH